MDNTVIDSLWPLARREGLKSRESLAELDIDLVRFGADGKLQVEPLFFDRQRGKYPELFKRASEMTAAERGDFIRNVN